MAVDGIHGSRKAGPMRLGVENKRADAGRSGRTRLARPNSHARTGTGKHPFPCSADHKRDW